MCGRYEAQAITKAQAYAMLLQERYEQQERRLKRQQRKSTDRQEIPPPAPADEKDLPLAVQLHNAIIRQDTQRQAEIMQLIELDLHKKFAVNSMLQAKKAESAASAAEIGAEAEAEAGVDDEAEAEAELGNKA